MLFRETILPESAVEKVLDRTPNVEPLVKQKNVSKWNIWHCRMIVRARVVINRNMEAIDSALIRSLPSIGQVTQSMEESDHLENCTFCGKSWMKVRYITGSNNILVRRLSFAHDVRLEVLQIFLYL